MVLKPLGIRLHVPPGGARDMTVRKLWAQPDWQTCDAPIVGDDTEMGAWNISDEDRVPVVVMSVTDYERFTDAQAAIAEAVTRGQERESAGGKA